MSETDFADIPVTAYGAVMLLAGVAYWILVRAILACQPADSLLPRAIGRDIKGNASLVIYLIAIPLTFFNHWIPLALFALVALMWFLPDRRIESQIAVAVHADPCTGKAVCH